MAQPLQDIPLSYSCLHLALHKSHRFGPLTRYSFHRVPGNYGMLHAVTASVRDISQQKEIVAAGGGLTKNRAFFAAIGEALERLSLRQHQYLGLTAGRYTGKDGELDPNLLLQGIDQLTFPLVRWHEEMEILWHHGSELASGKLCLIPAFSLFPNAAAHTPDGKLLYANTSTGTATSRERNAAILSGIYEVIERDAFVVHWENRWAGIKKPLDSKSIALLRQIESRGFDVSIVALSTDTGVPVALAAIADKTGYQAAISFGAAARATWEEASFRALEEALLTSFWISTRLYVDGTSYKEAQDRMTLLPEPSDHAYLYGFPQATEKCRFLFEAPKEDDVRFANPPDKSVSNAELEWALERLGSVRAICIYADITHPSAAALGLYVIRVVIPGFLPLTRGNVRSILNPRLVTIADALGRAHGKDFGFNPDPHPFP
ncbi:hypothetical protein BA011_32275 (plasmid) [Rhizobium leguminosarum]|uniref:YcaO domain-containing protein n=2 Tax=Rhizobium leguminosarum TaxID=384 RepID=A0A1B1CLJ5_RHILE|nr:hypothetical protein BA011_32275 [Rhizobium leguminosarum]